MPNYLALAIILIIASAQASAGEVESPSVCGEATAIFLPESQRSPAPNVELRSFQYMGHGDSCGRNVDHAELMRLHAAVKPVVSASLRESAASYSVMIRYTISQDAPADVDMRVDGAPESERARVSEFYEQVSALTDFHSESGTAEVVFHYVISPSASAE
jgi:hypothetical protein